MWVIKSFINHPLQIKYLKSPNPKVAFSFLTIASYSNNYSSDQGQFREKKLIKQRLLKATKQRIFLKDFLEKWNSFST